MKKRTNYTVDSIFVLVLFAVFAVTVLFVLQSGAGVYKDTQSVMEDRYQERTCLSYITQKVNHCDETSKISVKEVEGTKALAISSVTGGIPGTTYIYCYDGQVLELPVEDGMPIDLANGFKVVDAKGLEFEEIDNLIKVTCIGEDGSKGFVTIHVESELGGETA